MIKNAKNHRAFTPSTSLRAFTIVELLVVIVVIGILAAITIVSYTGISSRATVASVQADLSNASKLLKMYYTEYSSYPILDPSTFCPISPSVIDNKYCLKTSSGTTFNYVTNGTSSPSGFCLTATKNSTTYNVTENTSPTVGDSTSYGLVLNLDAGNSSSYPGSGTTWTDLSGLGNNGTLISGVGYNASNGGALTFDGINDYANFGNSNTLNFGTGSMSLSFWVISPFLNNAANGGLFAKKSFSTVGWDLRGASGGFRYEETTGGVAVATLISSSMSAGWNYVTLVRNVVNHKLIIYYNTTQNIIADYNTVYNMDNNNNLILSSNMGGWLNWEGYTISNVRIYNRAISTTEITQNFNALRGRYGL